MPSANKQLGSAFESRVVKRASEKGLKARKQPGSGVYAGLPNDVVIENLLVECKVRSASLTAKGEKRLTIDLDWLRGVQTAATREGFRDGIVVINPKGSARPLVLCDYEFWLELLNSAKGS
jgi:Holliday junction resolvase